MNIKAIKQQLYSTDRMFHFKGNIGLTLGSFIGLFLCMIAQVHPLAAGIFMCGLSSAISIEGAAWYHNKMDSILGHKPTYTISLLDGVIMFSGCGLLSTVIQVMYIFNSLPYWLYWKY